MPPRALVALLLAIPALLLGCGDDDGETPPDAAGADAEVGGFEVAPPLPPNAAPCPDGWLEEGGPDGTVICAPWSGGGPADCGPYEAARPGQSACVPIGSPCPAGGLPEGLPSDREVVYLLAGATGGDGSRALPFGSLTEFSLGRLRSGAIVAVGAGEYIGEVTLVSGVTLWGACVADTVLRSPTESASQGVVNARGLDTAVRNLSIGESRRPGLFVRGADTAMHVQDVLVDGVETAALVAIEGGQLTGSGVVARNTHAAPAGGFGGRGLVALTGAQISLSGASIEANVEIGVIASDAGTSLRLEDTVVRDTLSNPVDLMSGRGLNLQLGASAEVLRTVVQCNRDIGVFVAAEGTSARFEHVVVEQTDSRELDGLYGRGVTIQFGATAELSATRVDRNREMGIYVSGDGTSVRLTDVLVRGTESQASDLRGGIGVGVQAGSSADLTRVAIENNRLVGLLAGEASTLRGGDLIIRGTRSQESDQTDGRGMSASISTVATLSRVLVEENRAIGVFAAGSGTALSFEDLVVRETYGNESDGTNGRGLSAQAGARVEVLRGVIERSREVSVFASGVGTIVTLEDARVLDTLARDCAETLCADLPGGAGVGAFEGGAVSARRFAITRSDLCGVHLARDGDVDLSDGEISGHPIGVCVQNDDYDIARLTTDVVYHDNGINLDSTDLPIPDTAASLGGS